MSDRISWVRRLRRLAVALVAFVSLSIDYHGSPEQYFTYFTILTNLSIGTWFLVGAFAGPRWDRFSTLRLALTVYGLVTLSIYWVFLSPNSHPQGLAFYANLGLHLVVPLAMAAEDLVAPWPKIARLAPLGVLVFPLAYGAFTLIRGSLTGWYPYFFLDPAKLGGWLVLSGFMIFLFAVFLALAYGWRKAVHLRHPRA